MKQFKRGLAFLLAIVLVMSCLSVGAQAATTKKKATVKSVTITNPSTKTLVMKKGKTFQVKTKVTTTGKKVSKALTFASSNKKVATVSGKGKIKALANGKATITVTSKANKKKKATLKVVVKTPVTKVTLDKKELTLTEGEKAAVKATVSPKKATITKVAYTTSDKTVATVDSKGNITAVKEGKATITATAQDGNNKKATCKVTVVKKEVPAEKPAETPADKPEDKPEDKPADKPADQPQETPNPSPADTDWYDPAVKYDYKLENTVSENDAKWKTPSISTKDIDEFQYVWSDNFTGEELDRTKWNVEKHAPGWVNNELQEYVDDDRNIFLEDGNLVLRPIREKNADGSVKITSGRVNTCGKVDFKYGLVEARVKVPTGKGFLPAFWMMPTNENIYGQWPQCGEIDAMEVMGQETNKLYGTIHYGKPHEEKQGKYVLEKGNFADEYHTFSCKWEPGVIEWYVDGVKYHEAKNWFTANEGEEAVAFPAPFDQNFHIILNLAVGGSWVGYPDENTVINSEAFVIDYVKVFQKEEYNENVAPVVDPVVWRDLDESGNLLVNTNLIENGDFKVKEDLVKDEAWAFKLADTGAGSAEISSDAITIKSTDAGTVEHAVQLVQTDIPLRKGATYKVSFKAKASQNRKISCRVKNTSDWKEYAGKEVALTTEFNEYSYTLVMGNKQSNPKARIEFNMGNYGSLADVTITDVELKMTEAPAEDAETKKTILADGNAIYNGKFEQGTIADGTPRMKYWSVTAPETVSYGVTSLEDGRRAKFSGIAGEAKAEDVTVSQNELPLEANTEYALSFDAEGTAGKTIKVTVDGQSYEFTLKEGKSTYRTVFTTGATLTDTDFIMELGAAGETVLIDNVRIEENALIKNGSFNAGLSSFEPYVDSPAVATYTVDSQSEDNAFDITIDDTSADDWKIQLKQVPVEMEKGQYYRLKFKIKSSIDRKVSFAIQRNGNSDLNKELKKQDPTYNDWLPYYQEVIDLNASNSEYQIIEREFGMTEETDLDSVFNITMGAVGGTRITEQHRICIDDISLEKIDKPSLPPVNIEYNKNLIQSADFSDMEKWNMNLAGNTEPTVENGEMTFNIASLGTNAWDVELKQTGLTLENNEWYKVACKLTSTESRDVDVKLQHNGGSYTVYNNQNGKNIVSLEKDVTKEFVSYFQAKTTDDYDDNVLFAIDMGNMKNAVTSQIKISGISVEKVHENEVVIDDTPDPETPAGTNLVDVNSLWLSSEYFDNSVATDGQSVTYTVKSAIPAEKNLWDIQVAQSNIELKGNVTYEYGMTVEASSAYKIDFNVQKGADGGNSAIGNTGVENLVAGTAKEIKGTFKLDEAYNGATFRVNIADPSVPVGTTLKISNIFLKEVEAEEETLGENLLPPLDNAHAWSETAPTWIFFPCGTNGASRVEENSYFYKTGGVQFDYTVGKSNWEFQLVGTMASLEKGATYRLKATVTSDVDRVFDVELKDGNEGLGSAGVTVSAGTEVAIEKDITISGEGNVNNPSIQFNLGKNSAESEKADNFPNKMKFGDIQLYKVLE